MSHLGSSNASAVSHRPRTSSESPPAPQWYHDQICRELPPISSSMTLPDSPSRLRNRVSIHSPKRLSVFRRRSRSNTATSSSSSHQSPAPSVLSGEGSSASHRSSQDARMLSQFAVPSEKEEGLTKTLLSRGSRILRRQGSKLSITAAPTFEEDEEMARGINRYHDKEKEKGKVDGIGMFHRSHRTRHSDMHEFIKKSISEPFNFQHVTHTNPGQLPPVDHTHPHDLATEFSIIRASQRPNPELKGIRADSLNAPNYLIDNESDYNFATLAPDAQSLYTRSPPQSPVGSTFEPTSPKASPKKRLSRSVENFSRPASRLQKQPSSPSIIPPPRASSKSAFPELPETTSQTLDVLLGLHSPSIKPEEPPSNHDPVVSPLPSPRLESPEPVINGIGHAFSIDDSNARAAGRSPLSHHTDLADVPEEDESCSRRNSHAVGSSANEPIPTFRFGQSSPRPQMEKQIQTPPAIDQVLNSDHMNYPEIAITRPIYKQPQALGTQQDNTEPALETRETVNESWEDDIDYCYEHAAESNCDFDWYRASLEGYEEREQFLKSRASYGCVANKPLHNTKEHKPSAPQTDASGQTTNGETQSGLSAPSRLGNLSPAISDGACGYFASQGDATEKGKTGLVNVLVPHFEEGESHDHIYGNLIPEIHGCDEHYHMDDQTTSARSSCTPLSKCNSQESMMLSRAASIARKHRSSTSTSSVPDLIHSPNSSRETVDHDTPAHSIEPATTAARNSPVPSTHIRSKSLAREVTNQLSSANTGKNTSTSPSSYGPTHDRAKSVSILETQDSASMKANRQRSCTASRGAPSRKPPRTSYSLFPVPPTPTTPR